MTYKCKLVIVENTDTRDTTRPHLGRHHLPPVDRLGRHLDRACTRCRSCCACCSKTSLRHQRGAERDAAVAALLAWPDAGTSEAEIAFQPGRVLMHDTTSTPALVDIAAMRDTLAEAGVDPALLNPRCRSTCRSTIRWPSRFLRSRRPDAQPAARDAPQRRALSLPALGLEALRGVRIHPPGTGIMHTINLEQLATVVTTEQRDGATWAVPDTMIGTDSHTPMINGIGVLGWGVGGLEAQTVMFGMPTMLRIPDVIGVRLTGRLRRGRARHRSGADGDAAPARDRRVGRVRRVLRPRRRHADAPASAAWSPTWRPNTAPAPASSRSTKHTLAYLRATGRDEAAVALVEAYAKRHRPVVRPRRRAALHARDRYRPSTHRHARRRPAPAAGPAGVPTRRARRWRHRVHAGARRHADLPRHPIAIAAITSCTNTSDPRLLVAAGLVARKARALGLKAPAWVKTSLAPGSPAAASYLERAGLIDDLAAVGFDIVGYGCTTCIGNSGPLPAPIQQAMAGPGTPGGGAVGQPQLPRPRPSGPRPRLPDVAAAGDRLRAGRRRRAQPARPSRCS